MDAATFLQTVAGYAQAKNQQGSSDRPVKLAVIDPSFVLSAGLLPRVTFYGESTLSTKRYPHSGNYVPVAGDKVVMLPVGTSYWIVGSVGNNGTTGVQSDATNARYRTHLSQQVFLQSEGTNNATWGASGQTFGIPRTVVLAADSAGATSTTKLPSNLRLWCEANTVHTFIVRLKYFAGLLEDISPGFTVPSGATIEYHPLVMIDSESGTVAEIFLGAVAEGAAHDATAAGVGQDVHMYLNGTVFMGSTAGYVTVTYGRGSAGTLTDTLLRRGSWFQMTRAQTV